jgi:uncharacterized protein
MNQLSQASREELLAIARSSLESAIKGQSPSPPVCNNSELQIAGGCFVTYKSAGQLRGCIGVFESPQPIFLTVAQYARISATEDSRFFGRQIQPQELSQIQIELSILSPLKKIQDPLSLELGRHGIYIERDGLSGCFLPQVATEHNMDKERFLSECCEGKAGLPAQAWRDPDTQVSVFTAEIISDSNSDSSG